MNFWICFAATALLYIAASIVFVYTNEMELRSVLLSLGISFFFISYFEMKREITGAYRGIVFGTFFSSVTIVIAVEVAIFQFGKLSL